MHHKGFPAKGNPATKAMRIPMQMKSWLMDPSAPRISVGDIWKLLMFFSYMSIYISLHAMIITLDAKFSNL